MLSQHRVNAFPTILILSADGKEIGRRVGGHTDPDAYIKLMTPMVEKATPPKQDHSDSTGEVKEPVWHVNHKQAVQLAKKQDKPIMLHFTGSDWCGYCIKQHKEVFDTADFKKWANQNVVLLDIDFPRDKSNQPDELQKRNQQLKQQYKSEGYPTIVFVSADGKELGRRVGYAPASGPEKWIEQASAIVDRNESGGNADDSTQTDHATWLTSYDEALKQAQESGKPILADFTGSDWCPPCKMLASRVFDSDSFKKWAGEHVVLLELDYPRKTQQSDELKKQNAGLLKQYKVRAYPTIILMSPQGQEVGRRIGGATDPKAYIRQLEQILKKSDDA